MSINQGRPFRLTASPTVPSTTEPVEGSPAKSIKAVLPALTDFSAPHLSMLASIFVDWRGNVLCIVNSVPFDMQ